MHGRMWLLAAAAVALPAVGVALADDSSTPVPPPPIWPQRAAQGQLLWSASEPSMLGLFPSLGNGFISGDVGCPSARLIANTSSVHGPPTSCGALHIGGVFNDLEYPSHYGSVAHNLSIPHRADIPNPFAIYVDSLQTGAVALDAQYGRVSNLSMAKCEAQPGETGPASARVVVTQYAHRAQRSLLVLELAAEGLAAGETCTVQLRNCSLGWGEVTDFDVAPGPSSSRLLTVKSMAERSSTGAPLPKRPATEVGMTYQALPPTVTLRGAGAKTVFLAAFHTSLEPGLESHGAAAEAAAATLAKATTNSSASTLRKSHSAAWDELWQGGIEITGNATIASTVNSSFYYILAATRADWPYGLSPGGLARDDYQGHSFWDCETWMFPNLVALFPQEAHALAEYRSQRLPAALARARNHGYGGAMQPWESGLSGFGVSRDPGNDDHEVHISGDVAMAFRLLWRMSRDSTWLKNTAWPLIKASADFFSSRVVPVHVLPPPPPPGWKTSTCMQKLLRECNSTGGEGADSCKSCAKIVKLQSGSNCTHEDLHSFETVVCTPQDSMDYYWTINGVIPPDESAGLRNGSAYTNAIAAETMRFADYVHGILSLPNSSRTANWSSIAPRMWIPTGTIDGKEIHLEYADYTVAGHPYINQADVALMQYPLGACIGSTQDELRGCGLTMNKELAVNDLLFWQERSSGPSTAGFYTGDSAYSIAWLGLGNRSAADSQFDLAFTHQDLGHFNVWKEKNFGNFGNLNFITGAGGYLQNFINGYAGLRYMVKDPINIVCPNSDGQGAGTGAVSFRPVLPPGNVTAVLMRGVSLGGSRFTVSYDDTNLCAMLTSGPELTFSYSSQGGGGVSRMILNDPNGPCCCEYPKVWTYSDGSAVSPPQVAAECVFNE